MSNDEVILLDIIRAGRLALTFKDNLDKAAFLQDLKTQSAVLHQLTIMGEAVKRLSPDFRQRHREIPWKLIAGLRDVLIHGYDIVDFNQVWKTVTVDLPTALTLLEALVPK